MIIRVFRHAAVDDDIIEIAKFIHSRNKTAAVRFLSEAEDAITGLRFMPGRGSPKIPPDGSIPDIRTLAVPRFSDHLIVYLLQSSDVFVLAVVHGAQDYWRIVEQRLGQ